MTEDVSQLSVAELLARNGQQAAPANGGGGRRRRSGRGISVADLTGDIPVVERGASSHAAPDEAVAAAAPEPTSTDSDFSNYSNFPNYSDYSNFSDYSDFSSGSADSQPDYSNYSVPDSEPAYSPLSGPISFYDPLAPTEQPDSGSLSEPSGYGWSSGVDWPPAQTPPAAPNGYGANGQGANGYGANGNPAGGYSANGYAGPAAGANGYAGQSANGYAAPNGYQSPDDYAAPSHNGYQNGANGSFDAAALLEGQPPAAGKSRGGRRRKPDPLDSDVSLGQLDGTAPAPPEAPREGGRRRRFDPDDESTDEVHPFRGEAAGRLQHGDAGPSWSAPAAPPAPFRDSRTPGFDPMQSAAPAPAPMPAPAPAPAAPPMSRSARRHAEAQRQAEADRQTPDPRFGQDPRGLDRGPGFGARNGRSGRDEMAAPEARNGRGPARDARADDARRGKGALADWTARRRQAEAEPDEHDHPEDSWAMAEQDQQLLSGETVAGDLLRDARDREDERAERNSRRGGKRRAGGSRRRGAPVAEPDPDDQLTDFYDPIDDYDEIPDDERTSVVGRLSALASKATRSTRSAPARGRGNRLSEDDENRRQWMVLAGQSAGAAVAGMLLFKGFERMWELLPWVALALAMVVILGLVALVRVLRRTDDIFSTVIAVVVGVFVTLGPLAFLLSTN
ncbi:hypothetical protein [Nocardia inohanensis]|uniref:hypothetical protein n=1 Tax=Nocardia inohanensis TaxID=209246 RepID=UPI000B081CDF|nr:hypothetical protein [Nocardia inohanensis]